MSGSNNNKVRSENDSGIWSREPVTKKLPTRSEKLWNLRIIPCIFGIAMLNTPAPKTWLELGLSTMDAHHKEISGLRNDAECKDSLEHDNIDFAEAWAMLSIGVSVIVIVICIFLCVNIVKIELMTWVGN